MYDTHGQSLREAWAQKEKPECHHPKFYREHSVSGTLTGCYICTTCGQLRHLTQPGGTIPTDRSHLSP